MVSAGRYVTEDELKNILLSIIILYGAEGLPLDMVEEEFLNSCGYPLPYKQFGARSLKAWVQTLPDIYLVKNHGREVLIQQSRKSSHLKHLISKHKSCNDNASIIDTSIDSNNGSFSRRPFNRSRDSDKSGRYFFHDSINDVNVNSFDRYDVFRKLESMLPLFYKHQALGDDFFLDIADTKLGYYVPEKGPKECGLCVSGQTISELTDRVKNAQHIAPRVVVMIGFTDLIKGRTVNKMICDLRQLVSVLKERNTRVTLVTLIPSPKMPGGRHLQNRMEIFNKAILDYSFETNEKCNVIDMGKIFLDEQSKFQKDKDRFYRVTKKDTYRVFSDYGKKVFLSNLKESLKEQIECGH